MWHRPTRFSPSGVPRDEHRVPCCASGPAPTGFCGTRFDNDLSDNRVTLDPNQRIADINESQKGLCAQVPVVVDAGDHDSMALGVIVAPKAWGRDRRGRDLAAEATG